ncbi:MAG: nickel-dependent lactate racemase [Candidatus Binatia bacterium]|nr:nickel-dependent lactate racemase [Candidatus Binatia bacterium]
MNVRLDFGRRGIDVELPVGLDVTVTQGQRRPRVADPTGAVLHALEQPIGTPPLAQLAHGRKRAVVVISDKTRPIPYRTVLPPILDTLNRAGLGPGEVEILVATGLHRPNTADELVEMLGEDVLRSYRVRNHVARNQDEHAFVGSTKRGTEIWIDRGYLNADLRILTGLIEPHLMAGYSGGRKAVCPGIAGVRTIRAVHGPKMLEGWVGPGIIEGNPFHEEMLEVVKLTGADFLCDVTIDRNRCVTGVFAGDVVAAHARGVRAVEEQTLVAVAEPADVVLVSAGGYPLDQTLYQSIKGLVAALNVVRPGGAIVLVAELAEGAGSEEFVGLLQSVQSPGEFMHRVWQPDFFTFDQWMVQHLCQVLRKASVWIAAPKPVLQFREGFAVQWAPTPEAAIDAALRHVGGKHLLVIPDGPYTLATVRGRKLALSGAGAEAHL